ncbi:hypothetical protein LSM04_000282 [Trypanosoma melophagium]|uniref:uncharacterized protein n=1 Tax=Trypanosoma melophagium TaxID=715481 RepID=UPI00351AAC1D|nr:hypothetical protein LSM04_000282 [Trypanosoma melophagium]
MSTAGEETPIVTQTPQHRRHGKLLQDLVSRCAQTTSPKRQEKKSTGKASPTRPQPEKEQEPEQEPAPLSSFVAPTNTNTENGQTTTTKEEENEAMMGDDGNVPIGKTYNGSSFRTRHNNNHNGNSNSIHHTRTSSGTRSLFGRFVQLLTPSGASKATHKEDDALRNEPYADERGDGPVSVQNSSEQHNGMNGNPAQTPPLTTKTTTTTTATTTTTTSTTSASRKIPGDAAERSGMDGEMEMEEEEDGNRESCYYYETGSGEVYHIDPSALDELGQEEEEGTEDHDQQQQELNAHQIVKGKAVKALISEEAKARKHLQKDCLIVITDIGRTYRAMSRSITNPARDEKTIRRLSKQLEKDAVKGARAIEVEWKKEHSELIHTFRTTAESIN